MPRNARLVVPNFPHHLLQRGYRREPIFLSESDYAYYLDNLWTLTRELGCRVNAYCLMPNHVHLLVNPGEDPANLGRLMKSLAGRHARYLSRTDERGGAQWEGRFRSSPVAKEYALACCRYIELNPVRTYLARSPADYRWSSYPTRFRLDGHHLVTEPAYLTLGSDAAERLNRYANYVQSPISLEELSLIRTAIHTSRPLGDDQFLRELEYKLGRSVSTKPRGRPKATSKTTFPSFGELSGEHWDETVSAE